MTWIHGIWVESRGGDPGDEEQRCGLLFEDVVEAHRFAIGLYIEKPGHPWAPDSAAMNRLVETVIRESDPDYVKIRGVDYACEDCGGFWGSRLDRRGFYRCLGEPGVGCGYPGQ